jgi:P27 family predicted phage terminase small subunit
MDRHLLNNFLIFRQIDFGIGVDMKKPGIASAAELTVVQVMDDRLEPPDGLTDAELSEWRAIVNSLNSDFFRPSDRPLLRAFCAASALYKQALELIRRDGITITVGNGNKRAHPATKVLSEQAATMACLAQKLRLCPSSRYSPTKAATLTGRGGSSAGKPRPWE